MSKKRSSGAAKKTSASAKANFRSGGDKSDTLIQAIFPGESEMAGRMRDFDWSGTDLGPPSNWPESLRITVRICLTSRFPIVILWGPNYTTFYNDAYISLLGRTKHPQWLGRSGKECWQEIWPVIGPMLEGVFSTGRATWSQDLLLVLDRNLPQEEGYFTFSYSPILDDQNIVKGIFCACFETTEQVVGTRRLETLRKLGVQALETRSVDDACKEAVRVLAENPHDIPFAAVYLVEGAGTRAELKSLAGFSQDDHPFPSVVSVSDGDVSPWPLASTLRSRRVAETSDLDAAGLRLPGGPWPEPASKAVTVPIFAGERENVSGLAVLGISPRRPLDGAYRTFFSLIAGHIGTAISDARAYESEQKRAEALAELDRAKTAFFSNVSHEFRTPLTLMLGPLEDALRENPDARDRIEIAHRNSLRLLKLVNTLLDFSRLEAGRIEAGYEPTDLAAHTAELAGVFRSAIEKAGLRLVVDCPPLDEPVYVDREMWEKIVFNLLSNAFKFTFEGEIKVTLRRRGELVELSVSDTGVGIPETEFPKIFQRFHRVRGARSRTHEGAGIGLALAQELARLHGGEIKARSKEGEGSTFTVSVRMGVDHLPADRINAARQLSSTGLEALPFIEEALRWLPDEAARGAPSSAGDEPPGDFETPVSGQPATGRSRILVADDNSDMRAYLKRLLEQRYDVEVAPDGRTALEAARLRPPDLLITDVMMPGLDGFGLLKELRADERTRAVPTIMLSARAGEEARVEGLYAGADDYILKPFSARELVARVDSQLGMARLRRESEESVRGVNAELNRRLAELEKANLEILDSRRAALEEMKDAVRAKEALRESEERFRHMADNAPVMTCVTEPDAACAYLSRSWYEFTGQTPETGLGFGWLDATHPDDRRYVRDAFISANQRREAFRLEYRLRRRDGEYRWVIDSAAPHLSHDREFLGYISSVIDITERKRAEAFLACQKQSFEMAASGTPLLEVLEFLARGVENRFRQQTKVAIHLLDAAGERFDRAVAPSLPPGYIQATEGMEISSAASPCCAAVIRGERVTVADVAAGEEFPTFAEFALPLGIRAGWATPIFSSTGKALGTVAYYCHEAIKPHLQDALFDEMVTRTASVIIERKQAEEDMRQSAAQFETLLNRAPLGVYLVDADFRIRAVNPVAFSVFGDIPDLIGRDFDEVAHILWTKEYADEIVRLFRHTLETGESYETSERAKRRIDRGLTEYYEGRIDRIETPDGGYGVVCYFQDITERKLAEEAAAKLAAIVESSDDAIIGMDLNGIITSWNQGAEKLYGYAEEEIIGKRITILFPLDRLNEEPQILESLKRGERIEHYETARRCKDGHEIDISLTVSPIRDKAGKIIGASKIARDISERKRVEIEREEMLLKESAARAEAEAARAEAEAANRGKDEFLAVVSHELRSPLNAILGYNRMLREQTLDAARLKSSCDVIERSAKLQLQLIEDLLDSARIASGKLRLELRPLDVNHVIADALDVVRPAAEAKGVRLRVAGKDDSGPGESAIPNPQPVIVRGDAARLQQIIWNLLSNAIKFTPAGGSVELRAERAEGRVRITVSDTGHGIEPEFLPYIFDRFRQADSSGSRRHGGLGLGLALVKHLVEMHGGKVEAASEGVGRGSTFAVMLPLATHSASVAAEPPALTSASGVNGEAQTRSPAGMTIAGLRVLVVDDQEDARALLAEFLGRHGAVVMTASSGADALAILSDPPDGARPDILLCDIAMPEEDGYAALRRMRALEEARGVAASQRIPAVALTALTGNEERLRAIRAGFQAHITKPADPVELILVIDNIAGMWRRKAESN